LKKTYKKHLHHKQNPKTIGGAFIGAISQT